MINKCLQQLETKPDSNLKLGLLHLFSNMNFQGYARLLLQIYIKVFATFM